VGSIGADGVDIDFEDSDAFTGKAMTALHFRLS
jgi:hypothetical protein